MDFDPDRERFKQYDREFQGPVGKVVLRGSVPIWRCACGHTNHIEVPRCNNCGDCKAVSEDEAQSVMATALSVS